MKLAFIGAGKVGGALALKLALKGHDVVVAETKEGSASVAELRQRSERIQSRPANLAIADAEVVFLAIPFSANASVLPPLAGALRGKTIVDCTNPVGDGLRHGLESASSGSEKIAALLPDSHVVKAFSIYGFENFEDPAYPGYDLLPAMLFCGDDVAAKGRVSQLISDVGFEPVDVGGLVQALHLEHMTLLWVRMVRMKGESPHLVWGALRRPRPARA